MHLIDTTDFINEARIEATEVAILAVFAALGLEVTSKSYGKDYWMTVHTIDRDFTFDLANPESQI